MVQSKMSGKDFAAGAFASGLRQKLMREHMGCDLELVSYVEDTFAQYHEYARENHSRLHTLCGKSRTSKSRERQIKSSVIEVAMRIIFDVDSTAAWKHVHKGQSPLGLEPLVSRTRSSQFHKQLRLSQVFNTKKFIAHIDNFRSDAFKIINLLKGLFYLQHTVLAEKVVTLFSGLEYLSSKCFVSSMFKLANMIDPFNFSDVLDSSFCEMWDTTATRNTAIFRTVFYCQPDDHVKDGEHLFKKYEKQFLCCQLQLQLAKDPLLEASFEPADDILRNDATDEYTNKFVTELSSLPYWQQSGQTETTCETTS
ncbi:hypothetical protein ACO0QE_001120 [Hanseniaspora vineae]